RRPAAAAAAPPREESGPWARAVFVGRVAIEAVRHFATTDATVLAGHIAYTMLFALFPFLIFLTTVGGFLGQDEAVLDFVEFVLRTVPPEVSDVLARPVHEILDRPRPGLLTLSILVALWVASSGFEALRVGLNEAYEVDAPRALWWDRLQSFAFTLLLAVAIVAAMISIVAGPLIWALLQWVLDVPQLWRLLYGAVRYALGIGVLLAVIWALYYFLPNKPMRKRDAMPGAVVAVALWIGAASLFSLYLQNLANYSITYGSLGGIVVSLFFFYVSAAVFIFGAEVNAAIRRLADRREAPPDPGAIT
ncbi:MAG TPA: YihY/virulence factor BrkB family protein, partial [Geminicoccaceae bacterium]|nr:YihY/virulence factor BrkB family protein [Geminicoccaceae bacterium]